jgi:hypothetical protein
MFIPSFGEIFVIIVLSIFIFKPEDWLMIFKKVKKFKENILNFSNESKNLLSDQIHEIEKEILKNQILKDSKDDQADEEKNLKKSFDKNNNDINKDLEKIEKENLLHYKIFEINSKKYIFGEDGNLHEIFSTNDETSKLNESKNNK